MVHDYVRHQGSAVDDQTRSDKARRAARARWDDARSNAQRIAPSNAGGNAKRNAEREEKSRTTSPAGDDQFSAWWQHYPRTVCKGQARRAYSAALKKTDHNTLVAAADAFTARVRGSDPKFIAHPATWLNGERWTDQDLPADDGIVTTATGERWDLGEWA